MVLTKINIISFQKNSVYFGTLRHYKLILIVGELAVRPILKSILFRFVKPPSDTLLSQLGILDVKLVFHSIDNKNWGFTK